MDERFVKDERFADEDGENDFDAEDEETEIAKNLKIFDKIVGHKTKTLKKLSKKIDQPTPKMIRYNPSKTEHKIYEITTETDDTNTHKNDQKEISDKKYFDVSKSLIADLKEKKNEKTSFSLLKMIKNDDEDDSNTEEIHFIPKIDQDQSNNIILNKPHDLKRKATKNNFKSNGKSKSSQPFFFTTNDPRLKQGSEFFCRRESLESIRQSWIAKRSAVKKEITDLRKQALHRINPVQRLGNKKKFNFINERKRKFQ